MSIDEDDIYDAVAKLRERNKNKYMTTKEMSRQLRMIDTKYANAKKVISGLKLENDATESIYETLDAQHLVHRTQIVQGKSLFDVKGVDDIPVGISKVGGL